MSTEKFEFASEPWVEFARGWIEKQLDGVDRTGVDVSFCEEFTDPPAHLSSAGSIGWHMVINETEVTVGYGVIDAKAKIVADYATILPLGKAVIDPTDTEQAAELGKLMADAIAAGKATMPTEATGSAASLPQLANLHNALAEVTA